jgi:ribose transport system permease protein
MTDATSRMPERSWTARLRKVWDRGGILIILAAFAVILALSTDRFLTAQNLLNVGRQVSVLTLISLGLLVVIVTGNVDLTVGAWLGLAGALMAGWTKSWGIVPGLAAVFGLAALVGLNNGFLSTRAKGLSVIVTLAMMTIFQGATLLYTKSEPITGFPEVIGTLGAGYLGPVPVPVIIAVVAAALVHVVLRYMRFGRELRAIGGNAEAARFSGVPVTARVMAAFVISAMMSALAGLVLIARVLSAQPNGGVGQELDAVGAVLLGGASLNGGTGSVVGTLAGVLILGMINNGLNLLHIDPFYQYVVKGMIILFAILMDQWGRK